MVAGSRTRYLPFGAYRTAPSQTFTDRGYTSQKHNNDLGLIYYNARYYLPAVGRFLSADPIVPNPANPQAYNRYSYGYNNPVKYSDPSGHTPWDVIDAIFFGISAYQFVTNPTWSNAGWLALDAVSLLPVVPSVSWIRYGDEAAQLYNSIRRAVTRIGLEGGQNLLRVINRFDDGSQLTLDFLKIAEIPGAQKIAQNLANGAWQTVKGSRFELEYAVSHADDIAEIGRSLGGGREIDFVLKKGGFIDVKNYNWASEYYQNFDNLNRTINGFLDQAREYLRHTDIVSFTFKGSVPDAVRAELEAIGVIVEVIP